jgi:hypothetical protein
VREIRPLAALAQERELRFALDRHLVLDEIRDRRRRRAELTERRAAVPEDPRVAVVVRANAVTNAEHAEQLDERLHGMPFARVLVVMRDFRDRGIRLRMLDLEPRHKHPA